jgi:hypothetical protein
MAKASFAALPPRAIGDARLAAIHFRILAAVAFYDRLSGPRAKGAGCYASNKTLAEKCNVNPTNFSTAANELGRWGYLSAEPHPMNKRTRIYRVIYDALPTGKQSEDADSLPTGNASTAEVTQDALPDNEEIAGIVCPPNSQAHENAQHSNDIYIPLNGNRFSETEKYSAEAASMLRINGGLRKRDEGNDGAFLAMIERELKNGAPLDQFTRKHVEKIAESLDSTDALACQANRILEEYA